jgi:uncharacterized iron-regulated protein
MNRKSLINLFVFIIIIAASILIFYSRGASSYSQVLRVKDGEIISFDTMIEEIKGARIIFIGELHDNKKHHTAQLDVIKGIQEKGVPLSIGLEMFKIQDQDVLDNWVRGNFDKNHFLKTYYNFWSLPWSLYRDIFHFARDRKIPMVGLNVPKAVTKKVSEQGFQSLKPEELYLLPPGITCDDLDENYMEYVRTAYDEHEWEDKEFSYFCEAQMVWDKSMAWYLLDYINEKPGRTVIVLAGIGHSWKHGIPSQINRQSDHTFKVILPAVTDRFKNEEITEEDADYLLLR